MQIKQFQSVITIWKQNTILQWDMDIINHPRVFPKSENRAFKDYKPGIIPHEQKKPTSFNQKLIVSSSHLSVTHHRNMRIQSSWTWYHLLSAWQNKSSAFNTKQLKAQCYFMFDKNPRQPCKPTMMMNQ